MSVQRLTCEQCGKHFDVPEDKLPGQGRFRFTCPGCGGKNVVQFPKQGRATDAGPGTEADPLVEELNSGPEPEMFPPGSEVAFVFVQDQSWWERIESYLLNTGFHVSSAESQSEAVQKLRLNSYQWVILQEGPGQKALLEEMARWPGQQRREVNVVLLGSEAPSFDPRQAFLLGVNAYIALSDEDSAEQVLDQAKGEFEQVLEPWKAVREGGGRA